MSSTGETSFADLIEGYARRTPGKSAIVMDRTLTGKRKRFSSIPFGELNRRAERIAASLKSMGVKRGDRVLMFLMPDQDFVTLNLALNRILAVPILIDLGMGIKNMLSCIEQCEPTVMIGIPKAFLLRRFFPKAFRSIKVSIISKKSWLWRKAVTIDQMVRSNDAVSEIEKVNEKEVATIVFTSGSTGTSKGVVLTHEQVSARRRVRESSYQLTENDIELSTFPAFLLMSIASGRTCVLPNVDLTKPAHAKPEYLVGAVQAHNASHFFASPALLDRLTRFCIQNKIKLPSVKQVITGGAPIAYRVIERFKEIIPTGEVIVAYGATEALPVSQICLAEIVNETEHLSRVGRGSCVGRPVNETEVVVIENRNQPISKWDDDLRLPNQKIGEIVVKGECVTNLYFGQQSASSQASIQPVEPNDPFHWHRTGDLGFLDDKGRIWLCGRKAHSFRVGDSDYYPVQIEGVVNSVDGVLRSALVGLKSGDKRIAAIIYERDPASPLKPKQIEVAVDQRLAQHEFEIAYIFRYPRPFPVDKRHNSKIERLELGKWAQKKSKLPS